MMKDRLYLNIVMARVRSVLRMGEGTSRLIFALITLVSFCSVSMSRADTLTWVGSTDSDWATPANWSPAQTPAGGDVVIINASSAPATNVVVSSDTASLTSLTITDAVLSFTNWTTTLNATTVTIGAGGVFTLPVAFTNGVMSNRVHVVCTTLSIEAGGMIDVDGKGFGSSEGPGRGYNNYNSTSGAGHGGIGGKGLRLENRGRAYGLINAPVAPGSGGGGDAVNYIAGSPGGGAVRIEAAGGTVTINGVITANGAGVVVSNGGGGGSGGSIYITCGTFSNSGNGILRANGGDSISGAGSGGRIAVQYTTMSNSEGIQFSTSLGSGKFSGDLWYMGAGMGTLYLSDETLLSETLTDNLFTGVRLQIPGFNSWNVNSLTVSNCSVELAESGFQLTVTNYLTVGADGAFGVGAELGAATVGLSCGDIILTNGGSLSVYSGSENGTPDYGALVDVANDVVVGSESWIYPYSHNVNGGSVLFQMQELLISANAGFNAVGRGYTGAQGPGKGISASRASGAGYGGRGGDSENHVYVGGDIYGSTNAPIDPGSGGGIYAYVGGRGGGVVRIEVVNTVTLNGIFKATGGSRGTFGASGGGSGGGIYIQCHTLTGSGSLLADGGTSPATGGGGGGGRISVDVHTDNLTGETMGTYIVYAGSANGRVSVDGATGWEDGTSGTFFLSTFILPEGTLIMIQ